MLHALSGFSGFSVDSIENVKPFYTDILGLKVVEQPGMGLNLILPGGDTSVFVYSKEDHLPAEFTVLNLEVANIDKAVDELTGAGVQFEMYGDLGDGATQDEKGVLRGLAAGHGPDIAWFRDPAGNIFSILQSE